ncbi:MAG: hypothetical protein IPL27_09625 [Lewinellaceae bacterium]|nr:hypothetical protein [Lewinellaceae bacterium]
MNVGKVAQEDVADKIDTSYILALFQHIDKVAITFICTKDEREVADWTDEDGRHIVIRLPYKEVKRLSDIRPLMLAGVQERLGLMG